MKINIKNKIFIFTILFALLFVNNCFAYDVHDDIYVMFDNKIICSNSESIDSVFIDENSRVLIPFRKSLESIDANVEWDNINKIARAKYNETTLEIPLDKKYIIVNGEKKK